MRRTKIPPVRVNMFDASGGLNRHWWRWFQDVGLAIDNFRRSPDIVATADLTLTTDDFGKIILFDNGTTDVTCKLPTISLKDTYCWIGPIYRLGSGRVTITADADSYIEYSSKGGSIYCDEERRAAANVTLELVSEHLWGIIGGTGLWKTD
jgi:hypothetical protein